MAFSGYHVGLTLGRGLFGGYMMRLAGRGIVDPVDATISQRCFYSYYANIILYNNEGALSCTHQDHSCEGPCKS